MSTNDEELDDWEYDEGDTGKPEQPRGNSQEVFQRDHDRTVTERLHTFTCVHCGQTLTIMQYPAPSRRVCDECKTSDAAKAAKREYQKRYMAERRKAQREITGPVKRGRPYGN